MVESVVGLSVSPVIGRSDRTVALSGAKERY